MLQSEKTQDRAANFGASRGTVICVTDTKDHTVPLHDEYYVWLVTSLFDTGNSMRFLFATVGNRRNRRIGDVLAP